jgi:hypothetical protein
MLRAAYRYENNVSDKENTTTFFTGLSFGASLQGMIKSSKREQAVAFDYAFRPTRFSTGVHTLGLRINLSPVEEDEE